MSQADTLYLIRTYVPRLQDQDEKRSLTVQVGAVAGSESPALLKTARARAMSAAMNGRRVDSRSGGASPSASPSLLRTRGPESATRGGHEVMSTTPASITEAARAFFAACETGKGWAACSAYCQPGASFAAQAEPLADVQTLEQYAEWMKGILAVLPDASYAVTFFAA